MTRIKRDRNHNRARVMKPDIPTFPHVIAFGSAGERQAGSDFPVPTFALPRKVAFSLTTSRGASMSPRSVQLAWSSQRSVTKILPSTVPPTFTDFVLISPRMHACSPIVSVPVESIVPSTSPSISSSFRNLTEPLIETPRERRVPDGVGINVLLDGPGTTNGSGRFVCGGSVWLRGRKRLKGCTAGIVPNHSAFRKRNRFRIADAHRDDGKWFVVWQRIALRNTFIASQLLPSGAPIRRGCRAALLEFELCSSVAFGLLTK
jgi:hypothetical protein